MHCGICEVGLLDHIMKYAQDLSYVYYVFLIFSIYFHIWPWMSMIQLPIILRVVSLALTSAVIIKDMGTLDGNQAATKQKHRTVRTTIRMYLDVPNV